MLGGGGARGGGKPYAVPTDIALALLRANPDDPAAVEALLSGTSPEMLLDAVARARSLRMLPWRLFLSDGCVPQALAYAAPFTDDPRRLGLLVDALVRERYDRTTARALAQAVTRLLPRAPTTRRTRRHLVTLLARAAAKPEILAHLDAHFLVAALRELRLGHAPDLEKTLRALARHPHPAVRHAAEGG